MSIDIKRDLRRQFGDVRDQGERPTCMAFAASDAHAAARGLSFAPLSVEYAHYHAARRSSTFDPNRGVPLRTMAETIENDGQPEERGWCYLTHLPADLNDYKPPADPGPLYRRATKNGYASVDSICEHIDAGRPVIVIMQPTLRFHLARAGTVLHHVANDPPSAAAHAVLAVAHALEKASRCVLLRNSWGKGWADGGHVWAGEDYLTPRLYQIATMV